MADDNDTNSANASQLRRKAWLKVVAGGGLYAAIYALVQLVDPATNPLVMAFGILALAAGGALLAWDGLRKATHMSGKMAAVTVFATTLIAGPILGMLVGSPQPDDSKIIQAAKTPSPSKAQPVKTVEKGPGPFTRIQTAWETTLPQTFLPLATTAGPDGGLVIAGSTGAHRGQHGMVKKLDRDGAVIWTWDGYNGTYVTRALRDIVPIPGGGYFAVSENKGWIVRLDENGELVWQHNIYEKPDPTFFWAAAIDDDQRLVAAGSRMTGGQLCGYLVWLDDKGDAQAESSYCTKNKQVEVHHLLKTADGLIAQFSVKDGYAHDTHVSYVRPGQTLTKAEIKVKVSHKPYPMAVADDGVVRISGRYSWRSFAQEKYQGGQFSAPTKLKITDLYDARALRGGGSLLLGSQYRQMQVMLHAPDGKLIDSIIKPVQSISMTKAVRDADRILFAGIIQEDQNFSSRRVFATALTLD